MVLEGRVYCFACEYLWCVLSILVEEVVTEETDSAYQRWRNAHTRLANWLLEERGLILESEEIGKDEGERLAQLADQLGDSLIARWIEELRGAADSGLSRYPGLSKAAWLYHGYCESLHHVLGEFERVLQELGDAGYHAGRYREDRGLFQSLAEALHRERPLLDERRGTERAVGEAIRGELGAAGARLGEEWRKAVEWSARQPPA